MPGIGINLGILLPGEAPLFWGAGGTMPGITNVIW